MVTKQVTVLKGVRFNNASISLICKTVGFLLNVWRWKRRKIIQEKQINLITK